MFLKDYFKMKKVNDSRLMQALGACHSLTRINNEICGDPLEIEMFNATKWSLVEPDVPEEENLDTFEMTYVEDPEKTVKIYQIRQFAFSSEEARQTLVAQCSYANGDKECVFNYNLQ